MTHSITAMREFAVGAGGSARPRPARPLTGCDLLLRRRPAQWAAGFIETKPGEHPDTRLETPGRSTRLRAVCWVLPEVRS